MRRRTTTTRKEVVVDRRNSKTFSEVERSSPFSPRSRLTGDNPKVTSGAGYWRHEKQSSIAIVGRSCARETTVSPGLVYLSQLDIRFIDIFSQSFERLYLLLYNVVYLSLVHCCCTRDYPPCFGPRRTLVDQIGGG